VRDSHRLIRHLSNSGVPRRARFSLDHGSSSSCGDTSTHPSGEETVSQRWRPEKKAPNVGVLRGAFARSASPWAPIGHHRQALSSQRSATSPARGKHNAPLPRNRFLAHVTLQEFLIRTQLLLEVGDDKTPVMHQEEQNRAGWPCTPCRNGRRTRAGTNSRRRV
jgi:hypothetical protein